MFIGIDLIGTNFGSGTKTFNLNLLREILKFKDKNKIFVFLCKHYMQYVDTKHIPKNVRLIIKPNFISINFIKILWMQLVFPFELKILKIERIFSPMNYCPLFCKVLNLQIILNIHSNLPWVMFDMMPGSKIKNFFIRCMMFLSIKACDKLIVNSKFAKNELNGKLHLKSKRFFVNYLGIEKKQYLKNSSINKIKFDFKSSYILSVSSCVRYHNIINILVAFKNIKTKKKIKLVLIMQVLDMKYYDEIKEFIKKNFKNNEIILFQNLEKNIIDRFYKNCLVYVYSSYSEVFGLTTLEAMCYNIPLLLSNKSAIPEINANAALYFDPDKPKDIKDKMIKLIQNKNLRRFYIARGKKRINKFNWSSSYKSIIRIIKE
jgi:glycosyltransferase involved in cell wall biosynthesis